MRTVLEMRGVAFGYEGRPVIAGLDLAIERGRFLGVAGPNGSGKTTLLRGLLGLLPPLAGTLVRRTRALGYVPQREMLDPIFPLSVLEVVHMGAYGRLSGWRALDERERALAREALGRVGLEGEGRRSFHDLSVGQRQRVLIARALMMQPELLLLDEPISGVDRAAEEAILALLAELSREGVAVLLVTHQLAALRETVDELLWIDQGRVELCDPRVKLAPDRLGDLFLEVAPRA